MRRYVFEKDVKYQFIVDVSDTSDDEYDKLIERVESEPLSKWKKIHESEEMLKEIKSVHGSYADQEEFLKLICPTCLHLVHRTSEVKLLDVLRTIDSTEYRIAYRCNCGHCGEFTMIVKTKERVK